MLDRISFNGTFSCVLALQLKTKWGGYARRKINQIWKFRSGNNWVWQGEHMWNLSKYNVSLLYEMLSAHPWQISLSYNPQLVVSDLWCTLLIGFWQNNLQQLHTISLSPLGCFSKIYELQAEFFFFSFFFILVVLCSSYTPESESSVAWQNNAP